MVYLTTLSVTQDFMASNGGMIIEQWTRQHAEGSSHDRFEMLFRPCQERAIQY